MVRPLPSSLPSTLLTPSLNTGLPNTLSHVLTTHLPLLFPPLNHPSHAHSSSSFRQSQSSLLREIQQAQKEKEALAYALVQGVLAPLEAEMGWLGACLAGADGWVNVAIGLVGTS
jgi:autophagy-related protein 5